MFEVRASHEWCDDWEAVDVALEAAAGRPADFGGVAIGGRRDHGWRVPTLADAVALRRALEGVPGVSVYVREA